LTAAFGAGAILVTIVVLQSCVAPWTDVSSRRPLRRGAILFGTLALPFSIGAVLTVLLLPQDSGSWRVTLLWWQCHWAVDATLALGLTNLLSFLLVRRWQADGRLRRSIAVVGDGVLAERAVRDLRAALGDDLQILGVFDDRHARRDGRSSPDYTRGGAIADLVERSKTSPIDQIVVALPHAAEARLTQILHRVKQIPADIGLAPDLIGSALPIPFGRRPPPILEVYRRPLDPGQGIAKALFDRATAAFLLLAVAPILLVAAALIKLDSRGPVLFRQRRHGLGNVEIEVFKFRTMRVELADPGGAQQAVRGDRRVTRVGRILRRTRIDELPQLLNVLAGDLSLVGPRPMPLQMRVEDRLNHELVSEYPWRHRVKPGLTGWAQVNGSIGMVQTVEELRERVEYDLHYIDNWSFWFDIRILLMTLGAIARAEKS
jgi:exopolysaccharide biosynthesis polyprenyl glycosylphosphotransferase